MRPRLPLVNYSNPKKTFRIDELAKPHGVEVLRLPPYHPDLNPIEVVWAHEKVSQHNGHVKTKFLNKAAPEEDHKVENKNKGAPEDDKVENL